MKRIPLTINSHVIHLRKYVTGNKPSIILIHGLGVSGDYYLTYAKKLEPFFDVYIIDLPGYGKTPKPKSPLTIQALSNIVTAFVSSNDLKKSIIVGQSMGCQIVCHAVVNSPDLFSKALLLAPTTNKNERSVAMQSVRLFQDTLHESLKINAIVFLNYARMGVRRFLITANFMVNDHIEEVIKHINIPVLIVSGSQDKIAPKAWAKYLAKNAPDAQAIEIQKAPHLLQYQKPEELVRITREFTQV